MHLKAASVHKKDSHCCHAWFRSAILYLNHGDMLKGIFISVQWSDNGTFVNDLLWILSACVVDFSHFYIYVPTQGNIQFKWACTMECLVMRLFLSHLLIITAWRTEVMRTLETFRKLGTDRIAASICCHFPDFVYSCANVFLHWALK